MGQLYFLAAVFLLPAFLGAGLGSEATACWLSRYCTSSPTGLPVAPLALPSFQAVPAMSRCAQRASPTKRCKNLAAVIEPAARPATLPISAKLDLRPSA